MLFGWDWDEAKEVWQEEAREDGIAIGEARGEARGIAIGRDEGVAIGEAKSVLRTARQMKAKGLNIALIAEITGLSETEIEELD